MRFMKQLYSMRYRFPNKIKFFSGYRDEAEMLSSEVMSLPIHPQLSQEDLYLIVREVNRL